MRPIVSFISSPTYALSKFLAKTLSPLVGKTESYVASSSDFIDFSKTVRIPQGYALFSFDVVSLFTNVPTDLAIEVIERRLESYDSLEEFGLPAEVIIPICGFVCPRLISGTEMSFMSRSTVQPWVLRCQ